MSEDFPADLKQFIADNIDSIAHLELLLLLRHDPNRSWTAAEAGAALYSPAAAIAFQLSDLQSARLIDVSAGDRYSYRPETQQLDSLVSRLAELYRARRVAVVTAVYSKPVDKIRSFADAFRFRKQKDP